MGPSRDDLVLVAASEDLSPSRHRIDAHRAIYNHQRFIQVRSLPAIFHVTAT